MADGHQEVSATDAQQAHPTSIKMLELQMRRTGRMRRMNCNCNCNGNYNCNRYCDWNGNHNSSRNYHGIAAALGTPLAVAVLR